MPAVSMRIRRDEINIISTEFQQNSWGYMSFYSLPLLTPQSNVNCSDTPANAKLQDLRKQVQEN